MDNYFQYIVLLIATAGFFSCNENNVAENPSTYANPVDIDYTYSVVNTHEGNSYRSGADPAVVPFGDDYYMFVTRSQGYWKSDDLRDWKFVRPQNWFFESSNAPGAWPMDDSLLIALANPSGWQNVIYTDNPGVGTWQGSASVIPLTPIHDPALFVDDDGSVYMYRGSSNKYPIWGVELDPGNYFLPTGENKDLVNLEPEKHGWERFGENHKDGKMNPFIEGPWMNKHDGTYYLQYAAPGTEFNVYGDGVYTSDDPLGPFTYQEYSPFSYKPEGFIRGAGHGSTVEGPYGNFWHYGTMVVGINYNFERRIGKFRAGFDEDGQLYTNTAYGDYPHYLPSSEERDRGDWFTGWMLLSYDKPVEASSTHKDYDPQNVVDEDIKSFWVAESNKEESLTIDLEEKSKIRAIQINYADYESNIYGKPDTLYHQYVIEYSDDGENWNTLVDKSDNDEDVPNDYVELASPQQARYIRFTNIYVPMPNLAVSGLRVFGKGTGSKPAEVEGFKVERKEDRRNADLEWEEVKNAQGYHLYYGTEPAKLYNSVMVYDDTSYSMRGLNVDPDYHFAIEAFNENGISERSSMQKAD